MIGKILRVALLLIGLALLGAASVAIWLHFHNAQGQAALYASAAVPFAIIPAVLAIVVFGAGRHWILTGVAVLVTVGLVYTQVPLWRAQTAPVGDPITVVSANMLFGGADVDALARVIADVDADVVSFQEVTPQALERLRTGAIGRQLPHDFSVPGPYAAGTALFSKTPLSGQVAVPNTILKNLKADSDLPGAPNTQVIAVHPAAPLRGKTQGWKNDIDQLRTFLHALPPGRIIAAGDFNATWDQARYRALLQRGIVDATDQAGEGFEPTWPTDKVFGQPFLALDHVISRGFVATSLRTYEIPGSDHRAVVVTLVAS